MNINFIKRKVKTLKAHHPCLSARDILAKFCIHLKNFDYSHSDGDCPFDLIDGCYLRCENTKFVFINPNLCDNNKNITYAHELGHVILHSKCNTFKLTPSLRAQLEKEADIFAAEFLLNDDIFDKYINCSIDEVAACENVTPELVKLKIKYLDKSKVKHLHNIYTNTQHMYDFC